MENRRRTYAVIEKLNGDKERLVRDLGRRLAKVASAVGWTRAEPGNAEVNLLFVIGGDGTMTHAMKKAAEHLNNPDVVGINIGKLGFLAEIPPDSIEEFIIAIANDEVKVDERYLIAGGEDVIDHDVETETFVAVNEFAIIPKYGKDVLFFEYKIDNISSGHHHANGLILATPTGSTAYSLSVGGSILQPQVPAFQIVPIAPISMNSKAIVVSNCSKIRVAIVSRANVPYQLIADGQVVLDDLTAPYDNFHLDFEFHLPKQRVRLLHKTDWNFFDVLQKKLHWSTKI